MPCINGACDDCYYLVGGKTWEVEADLFSAFSVDCHFLIKSNCEVEIVKLEDARRGNVADASPDPLEVGDCEVRRMLLIPVIKQTSENVTVARSNKITADECKSYTCDVCEEAFSTRPMLRKHVLSTHTVHIPCNICKIKFPHKHESSGKIKICMKKKTSKKTKVCCKSTEEHTRICNKENITDDDSTVSKLADAFSNRFDIDDHYLTDYNTSQTYGSRSKLFRNKITEQAEKKHQILDDSDFDELCATDNEEDEDDSHRSSNNAAPKQTISSTNANMDVARTSGNSDLSNKKVGRIDWKNTGLLYYN